MSGNQVPGPFHRYTFEFDWNQRLYLEDPQQMKKDILMKMERILFLFNCLSSTEDLFVLMCLLGFQHAGRTETEDWRH
jgi:hypothetical protein